MHVHLCEKCVCLEGVHICECLCEQMCVPLETPYNNLPLHTHPHTHIHTYTLHACTYRGLLEMVDFERRVIPTFGLQDLVLDESTRQQLDSILNAGKTQKFISAQWGFGSSDNVAHSQGITCLLCGRPGMGKSAIAHAIAYELGQPIKVQWCRMDFKCGHGNH